MTEYEAASEKVLTLMQDLLSANLILAVMGFVCALLNVPLIYVLLASPKLRHDAKVKLILCLAWGDLANCLSYSLLGYYRYTLFIESLSTKMIPVETSLSCAMKPNVWFRTVGNVWPPTVIMLMGVDRVIASMSPFIYRKRIREKTIYFCTISVLIVLAFCVAGLIFSIQNHSKGKVKFDCGRKATFSRGYARAIYFWEMSGFAVGCVLNLIAYYRTKSILSNMLSWRLVYCVKMVSRLDHRGFREVHKLLKRIRYSLVLSVLSTILVSIPNMKSVFLDQLRFAGLDEWISQMFNWASIINSSINIFIYLWLYREFRQEFVKVFLHLLFPKSRRKAALQRQFCEFAVKRPRLHQSKRPPPYSVALNK